MGTSQAAAHVSGLATLVKQCFPGYGAEEVVGYLKRQAVQYGNGSPNYTWGYGLARVAECGR